MAIATIFHFSDSLANELNWVTEITELVEVEIKKNGEHGDAEGLVRASRLGENRNHHSSSAQGSSFSISFLSISISKNPSFFSIFCPKKQNDDFWPFSQFDQSALSVGNLEFSLSVVQQMIRSLYSIRILYVFFYISIHIRMYCINWFMYCTVHIAGCTILTEMALWASMVTVFSNSLFWFSLIVWVLRKLVHDFVKFVFFCQNSLHSTSSFLRSEIPVYVYNSEI